MITVPPSSQIPIQVIFPPKGFEPSPNWAKSPGLDKNKTPIIAKNKNMARTDNFNILFNVTIPL